MTLPRYLTATILGLMALATSADAAERLNRERLLEFRTPEGKVAPVTSVADWQKRRAEILTGMQAVMGPLPGAEKRVPLDVRVESETDCGSYLRREISYASEPGGRVPAILLLPKVVLDGKTKRPGVLALMGTNAIDGHRPVAGLGTVKPGRNYGEELVWRGYVVMVTPYPHLGPYKPDLKGLGYVSGTMKGIWDNIRALDVLETVPGVAPGGFGAIGLSLGGHNSIYTAVFDERIKVVISACGFDSFLDYMNESMWQPAKGWAQERYMPRILNFPRTEIPFDFHELAGALAPRAFLVIAPKGDTNFKWESVARIVTTARPVFALHGASEKLAVEHPDGGHDFPRDMREKAYAWLAQHLGPGETR